MPNSTESAAPVIVIGGGISGLACAFRLKQLGIPAVLFEKSDRCGGVISTAEEDGFLFEFGPQGVLLTPPVAELVEAVGMAGEMLRANPRAPRFIYHGGKLVPAPMSPPALLRSSLLNGATKWRLATEPLRHSHPPEFDESVAAFVRRKFGASLLDSLVAPFVSGVYAGDPEQLSLRAAFPQVHEWEKRHGSVLRGAIKQMRQKPKDGGGRPGLVSFRCGVGSLLDALRAQLGTGVHSGVSVNSVTRGDENSGAHFTLEIERGERRETIAASTVIIATEPQAAAKLLRPISLQFCKLLEPIAMVPVAMVAAGYRRGTVGHPLDGFGFLVPRKEGLRTLGTVWNSSLFPRRAPQGYVAMTSFVGGATDPEITTRPDEQIAAAVHEELVKVLQIREQPVVQRVQRYERALPQYNIGHTARIEQLEHLCRENRGIHLAGNYLAGPSFGACVERAFQVAREIEALG
jgi:oxygen-dependent protoporphyrinogen oxidase